MNIVNIDFTSILLGALSAFGLALPAYLKFRIDLLNYKKELNKRSIENNILKKENNDDKIKLQFFNRIMDIGAINSIKNAVDDVFSNTKADRFLILVAINGKTEFNIVNVIFEQKQNSVNILNAIAVYRNVEIDIDYVNMLKSAEKDGVVVLDTNKMNNCLLKTFYEIEAVKHSLIRFICRKPIDEDNDFLVFSSLATHQDESFTLSEQAIAKLAYESHIKPSINKVLN